MTKQKLASPPPKSASQRRSQSRSKRAIGVAAGGALLVALAIAMLAQKRGGEKFADLPSVVQPGAAAGYNLLFISLDTVRRDHLGTYGYAAAETPNIDALAERGFQFENAITPVPITLPSHASMMTGLYPPRHGVRDNGLYRLAAEHTTLAERLSSQGYETAAFVGCFVLDKRFGLDQGFDVYNFEVGEGGYFPSNFDFNQRSAGAVTGAALQWLGGRRGARDGKPFFMWLHYFDAHVPYASPLGNLPRFAGRAYDAEIAYIDQALKRLFDELDATGLRDRTLIVLVADHGEGLGEHDESTHGLFVYDSTMRIPFILSCPSLFRGAYRDRERAVSLVDLRPTIEDLLGLAPEPDAGLDGVSLVRAQHDPGRTLYIETMMAFHAARCSPLYGLRRVEDKFIDAPEPEYYDLVADAGELKNLASEDRPEAQELARDLDAKRGAWSGADAGAGARDMSDEEAERLRSLGYVHSAGARDTGNLPDIKAMMRASKKLTTSLRLQKENRLDEALRTAKEASNECPGYLDAASLVAQLCDQMKRPDEAIDVLEQSLEMNPSSGIALQLARTHMMAARYAAMDSALATAATLDPGNGFVHVLRADRHSMQGQLAEAIAEYEAAIRIDEFRVGTLVRPVLEKLRAQLRARGSGSGQ
ncbi:MAG: sulfatase-like hydrolase/transferase [bacterium]